MTPEHKLLLAVSDILRHLNGYSHLNELHDAVVANALRAGAIAPADAETDQHDDCSAA